MKILHVFDCAAVACTIAKFQRIIYGHDTHVISFQRMDPFGFVKWYGYECLQSPDPTEFFLNALDRATDYDVIHVHFTWGLIPYLRKRYADKKKIILHYHGSDIRQFQTDRTRIKAEGMADAVIGTTKELVKYSDRLQFIPVPIDTDHFKPISNRFRSGSLCITRKEDDQLVRDHVEGLGLKNVQFIPRHKNPKPYKELPCMFSAFDSYVDIKFQDNKILPTDSKTGYEALSCGLSRIDNHGNITTGLPKYMCPEEVLKQIEPLYQ